MTPRTVVILSTISAVVCFALGTTFGAARPWEHLREAQPAAPAAKQPLALKPRGDRVDLEEERRRRDEEEGPLVGALRVNLFEAQTQLTAARLSNLRLRLEAELPKGEATKEALDRFMAAISDEITEVENRAFLRR